MKPVIAWAVVGLVLVLTAVFMFKLSAPARADIETRTAFCAVSAVGADGYVTCDGTVQWPVQVDGLPSHLGIEVEAPPAHCSDVIYTIWTPKGAVAGTTRALGGGEYETIDLGRGYGAGLQVFDISVKGVIGGCNQGQMSGWGVLMRGVLLP